MAVAYTTVAGELLYRSDRLVLASEGCRHAPENFGPIALLLALVVYVVSTAWVARRYPRD